MPRAFKTLLLVFACLPAFTSADACKGTVYLTFDTGTMAYAREIAEVLRAEGVKATFFLANEKTARGDYALDAAWADYWRGLVSDGHSFGNHTWDHLSLRRDLNERELLARTVDGTEQRLDARAFCGQLQRVDQAFKRLTGRRLSGLWRAPGGRTTQQAVRWAADCGYPVHVGWDSAGFLGDELPSETHPNDALLKRAVDTVQAGDVLMMHLGIRSRRQPFAPMVKPLIQGLKARGLCFAPLGLAQR